jgi:molecular chaperone GrpE
MSRSRSDHDEHREDTGSTAEGGGPGEDSIEILEVVGLDPDSPDEHEGATPAPPAAVPGDEDESIPYSRKELYDQLLRKQAEFENVRKRQERDRGESRQRLWMDLLGRLLPILDNFHRALSEAAATPEDSFRRGIALTVQQMQDLLQREGLEEIEAVGRPFDPHLHEAVETRLVDGMEEGIVLEDLRKGYRFQGQLLRPTLVRVSAKGGKRQADGA